ncbi:CAZyme family GH18 [Penicillium angulare]|uniref:chitinase n=1 Tax=Penicillium angulare TaxID=116970 RepID=A0A9W9KL46_9EURO|nr:CAZyme family GH18 [Penicillium angulare]
MVGVKVFAGAAALMSSFLSASLALDVDLQSNVAVYYGQGANQPRLSHFCQETSMDIINLGFINVFPAEVGDWPGSNFGNQCDGTVYEGTELLKGCHQIWEDIPVCKAYGKTVLLSIGGDSAKPGDMSDEVAEWFADFLWYSFGPYNVSAVAEGFPRPFELNVLDGFDFDIESDGPNGKPRFTLIS